MADIFDLFPTISAVAADLKVPYTTAASWKARGNFPAKRDLDLIEAAKRRGKKLTLDQIARARCGAG